MPNVLDILLSIAVVTCAIVAGLLVHRIRANRLSTRTSMLVTTLCGVGLIVMVLTDWPVESMSQFWATHSVLASLLSSLLLVGLVFMVYERAEQNHQAELAAGLSGAGAGGLVDHLVDIEVALALLSASDPPERIVTAWEGWDSPGKPLRWLRRSREVLDGNDSDPRSIPPKVDIAESGQRADLVDQAIRRLLAGMRDWTPLVGASAEGTAALLILSNVRSDLMHVHGLLTVDEPRQAAEVEAWVSDLRLRLRVLAVCFEEWSGAPVSRHEVLHSHAPLSDTPPDFGSVGQSLSRRVTRACEALGFRYE